MYNKRVILNAEVAQLVEQLIRNEQVVGSSPIFGSIRRWTRSYDLSWVRSAGGTSQGNLPVATCCQQ